MAMRPYRATCVRLPPVAVAGSPSRPATLTETRPQTEQFAGVHSTGSLVWSSRPIPIVA